jgi:capsule polysaccharide export protein KpsE/RkpR
MIAFVNDWFTASTSIMPPESDSGGFGFGGSLLASGLGSLLGGTGMTLPGMATPSDLYASVLQSRAVCKAVIKKHHLEEVYDSRFEEEAIGELLGRTQVIVEPQGIIVLSHTDTDPERAAAIANTFVEELNRVNRENLVSKAKAVREFVEQRLNETINDLADAEEAYKNFQKANFTVALDEQVKAVIDAIAQLRGQLMVAEIEFGVMKKSLSATNLRYQEQQYKIEQIKEQLGRLEGGEVAGDSSILSLPMGEAPDLALQLARLTRELKIQETIFELLKQQHEQSRIQELRDTPTIQVLDRAEAPRLKSRPKRIMTAAMGGILSFGMTLVFILALEFVQREKANNSLAYKRIQGITQMLNDDFYWLRNLFTKGRNSAN